MATFRMRLFTFWVALFGAITVSRIAEGQKDESINRINYGVMFRHMGRVSAVTDIWKNTFAINLVTNPRIPEAHLSNITRMILERRCPTHNGEIVVNRLGCNLWAGNAQFLDEVYASGHERVLTLLNAIQSLIPNYNTGSNKRITKSLLPFMAPIFKSLFNLASMDDVKVLQSHIVQMAKLQDSQTKVLQKAGEHMSSFVSTSIARIDGLAEAVRNNMQFVRSMGDEALQSLGFLNNLTLYTAKVQHAIDALKKQYANTLSAMESLVAGRLSPILIPMSIMSNTLEQISTLLQESDTSLRIIHEPSWLYTSGSFLYAFSNGTLYITVNIPLTSFQTQFETYRIDLFPSALHDKSEHVTMLQGVPEGIGVDLSEDLYFTLTKQDLNDIALRHYEQKVQIFQRVNSRSCIMAIFEDNKEQVDQVCKYNFMTNSLETGIYHISQSTFLILGIDNYTIQCGQEEPENFRGCQSSHHIKSEMLMDKWTIVDTKVNVPNSEF